LLRYMMDAGADIIGDPSQSHCVAIDARAPQYDGGVCTRIDCVALGVVVDRDAQGFIDEGEDFWQNRYAISRRLVGMQPGHMALSISDSEAVGRFMPPVFLGTQADTLEELARRIEMDVPTFVKTITEFNKACMPGSFDHTKLDDCHTQGLGINKTHWALPLDKPPFFAYPLRPGITFTYLGLKVNEHAVVHFDGTPSQNLFVAGEMMAGNVLGKGYTAGVGMSIGTGYGRIAGDRAASGAKGEYKHLEGEQHHAA